MSLSNAKSSLVFYIERLWEAAGMEPVPDMRRDIEGIVDDIVSGVKEEIREDAEPGIDCGPVEEGPE